MKNIFDSVEGAGVLDYVTAWYMRAAKMMQKYHDVRAAFVSTNSITQGEQVQILWHELMSNYKININFAHQTFKWGSDISGGASAVHCVIIGFSQFDNINKQIYFYKTSVDEPQVKIVNNINPYLIDAPNIFLENRKKPICEVPDIIFGNMPNDGGNLLLSNDEKNNLIHAAPKASKWIRQFIGADEFLNGIQKWCLWLIDITPTELMELPRVYQRVNAVKNHREKSHRNSTQKLAKFPTRFGEIRQPSTSYILIPRVSSEKRQYIPRSRELVDSDPEQAGRALGS